MNSNEVKVGLRIKISRLKKNATKGFCIHERHVTVRQRDVTGTILQHVPGHGGDVWFVKHDNSEKIGAYSYLEFEKLPLWHDEFQRLGFEGGIMDRLKFQHGLYLRDISKHTDTSIRTVKKHCDTLVERGLATWKRQSDLTADWILALA